MMKTLQQPLHQQRRSSSSSSSSYLHKQQHGCAAMATAMCALALSVSAVVLVVAHGALRMPSCPSVRLHAGLGAADGGSSSGSDAMRLPCMASSAKQPPAAVAADRAMQTTTADAHAPPHARRSSSGNSNNSARTLSFDVCNGFANQRLSIVYGAVIAKQLARTMMLPPALLDGTQLTAAERSSADDGRGGGAIVPFEEFYDAPAFVAALAQHGVRAVTAAQHAADGDGGAAAAAMAAATIHDGSSSGGSSSNNNSTSLKIKLARLKRPIDDVPYHFAHARAASHMSLDCPLFKLSPAVMRAEERFIWALLDALKPAPRVQAAVDAALARFGGWPFNFVHLRLERDWQAHCARWAALSAADGVVRDNCWNNTLDVATVMRSMGFDASVPVYVAAHWEGADPAVAAAALGGIQAAGYTVVRAPFDPPAVPSPSSLDAGSVGDLSALSSSPAVSAAAAAASSMQQQQPDHQQQPGHQQQQPPPQPPQPPLSREQRAAAEYAVALAAARFLGNSVSTFSALAIMQRRRARAWAGHYNGGDVPLARVLPLLPAPWVFTFNSWSHDYEPMLKAAVNSAARAGGIDAHCVFAGDPNAPVVAWLRARGVTVHHHDPAWRAALAARAAGRAAANLAESHLFASEDAIVGTWQRIDVPIVPGLDQFTYVLFTDADVVFRRPFGFHELPLPLPRTVGMGPEMADMFPYNAGVMVLNLPALRASYGAFLAFVLANTHGLTFPGYGPGDQGAYNQFYEADARAWRLPGRFNAKPYRSDDPPHLQDAVVVHFHGPKPADYMEYAETGACARFGSMCAAGMRARACVYVHEWVRRLDDDEGGGGGGNSGRGGDRAGAEGAARSGSSSKAAMYARWRAACGDKL